MNRNGLAKKIDIAVAIADKSAIGQQDRITCQSDIDGGLDRRPVAAAVVKNQVACQIIFTTNSQCADLSTAGYILTAGRSPLQREVAAGCISEVPFLSSIIFSVV